MIWLVFSLTNGVARIVSGNPAMRWRRTIQILMTKAKNKLKRYQVVQGKKILAIVPQKGRDGVTRDYYGFRCDCGDRFTRAMSTIIQAQQNDWPIRCNTCALNARKERDKGRSGAVRNDIARRSNGGLDLKAIQLTPEQQQRVDSLVARHRKATMHLKTPVDDLGRVYVEAVEIVLCEAREATGEDYFAPVMRQAVAFQSYPQYFTKDTTI